MSHRFRSALLVLLAIGLLGVPAAGLSATAGAAGSGTLTQDLDAILANPSLAGGQVGLVVKDAKTGAVLYEREPGSLMLPASNLKLFTSASAMNVLSPGYTFTTSVLSDGRRTGPVVNGNLYLRGTGDPTMLAADYDTFAASLASSGVKVVTGQLVADDTWFDDVRLAPGWEWDDEPYYYDSQVSALTVSPDTDYDPGSVDVTVTPAAVGAAPKIDIAPATNYLTVVNTAVTGPAGSPFTETVDRDNGTNTLRITGSIPAGASPDVETMSVWNPTAFVASLFRDSLARHGIHVIGDTAYRATPASATVLTQHTSIPLSQLLTPFLKLSNNLHAETLVKAAGRKVSGQGSWTAGMPALESAFGGLGVDSGKLSIVDGSGLSRMDYVTPDQITSLLLAAQTQPWFQTWYNALPVAGNSDRMVGGTLRNRMVGTAAANNMHAKTGSMTGVSALSGYVTAANGEKLVFSMVENNFLGNEPTNIEDAVGVRLATYNGDDTTSNTTVRPATRVPARLARRPLAQAECTWNRTC